MGKVDLTLRNTEWHLFSTMVSFLSNNDIELYLNVANVAECSLLRHILKSFKDWAIRCRSSVFLRSLFRVLMTSSVSEIVEWRITSMPSGTEPAVDDVPLRLSLCHHSHVAIVSFHTPAESWSHDTMWWLSKPTVLVSVLHKEALCLVTHPHVLD